MDPSDKNHIIDLINTGEPVAIWGSISGGIDPALTALSGIKSDGNGIIDTVYTATLKGRTGGIYQNIPNTFSIYQPASNITITGNPSVVYQVYDSPALVLDTSGGRQLMFWDPPELAQNIIGGPFRNWASMSADEILGSPYPWVLTSRTMNGMLADSFKPYCGYTDPLNPVSIHAWRLSDGTYRLLAADTEEGINHTADRMNRTVWCMPGDWMEGRIGFYSHDRSAQQYMVTDGRFHIILDHGEMKLFSIQVK
jgi:hypothetical protein